MLDVYRHGELELKVLSVIWDDDGSDAMIVLHRGRTICFRTDWMQWRSAQSVDKMR